MQVAPKVVLGIPLACEVPCGHVRALTPPPPSPLGAGMFGWFSHRRERHTTAMVLAFLTANVIPTSHVFHVAQSMLLYEYRGSRGRGPWEEGGPSQPPPPSNTSLGSGLCLRCWGGGT